MKHKISHNLDARLAHLATDKALDSYKKRFADFNPDFFWESKTLAKIHFNAKGIKLAGIVELFPKYVELELKVPFLFRIFQKRAVKIIEEEIKKWISKAQRGELN